MFILQTGKNKHAECPYCKHGTIYEDNVFALNGKKAFCTKCGEPLLNRAEEWYICSNCNNRVRDADTFCIWCGTHR